MSETRTSRLGARITELAEDRRAFRLESVPEGYDAYLLGQLARESRKDILFVLRDDLRMAASEAALAFFGPEIEIISFPAWDCLPYDRVSPNPEIVAHRMTSLGRMTETASAPRIFLTTLNAATQRVPPVEMVRDSRLSVRVGDRIDGAELTAYLIANGFSRIGTVMEPGEFAVRGGLIDIFPPGAENPVRLDLFGDSVDGIREFDALSQRSTGKLDQLEFTAASEFLLNDTSVPLFRSRYREEFGAVTQDDPLYEAVSEKRRHAGMEHWLPLYHDRMATVLDYLPEAVVFLDHRLEEALAARHETVIDYFETRKAAATSGGADYKPLDPRYLYLDPDEWHQALSTRAAGQFSPFKSGTAEAATLDADGHAGRDFAPERARHEANIYDYLKSHVIEKLGEKKQVILAYFTNGSRSRNKTVLADHGIEPVREIENFRDISGPNIPNLAILPIEKGFETPDFVIIGEQDVLGDRLVRPRKSSRRHENFIAAASQLSPGDYVVHVDHGIAQYEGLTTIEISGAPHDCVTLLYAGGDKIYLPVENIEMLSRYGGSDTAAVLDKLGGSGWQARKAKLKKRVMEMADQLIKIAAARQLRKAERLAPPDGLYAEFCADFPFEETEDQLRAIEDTLADMSSGKPMDRLICGDVGFGKTEVALRAAFTAAMAGKQVAIVTPTTLLARQHFKGFTARFADLPVRIAQLSRMVTTKEANQTKADLASGQIDIVIGTHALLAKSIEFKNLGLVIVDEEQHFGVAHKERLKELRADVHVLTLTATPIPRTLQLAMSGIRDLSIIATPPVDRLAIRTFVLPFDPVVLREALLREHYRGGQSFIVVPRLTDLPEVGEFLRDHVPEVKYVTAHGQLPAKELDSVMNAFYDGSYDVLVATNIVESGLDIPSANTLITYRADMFGLAQLYQIRGRIGRSKTRAYAYLTLPPRKRLTDAAEKRLRVLQSLDTLGAGFTLASHDLDIRGAGNLLGDEQSGHIKEVGFELYQEMLEEAVATARETELGHAIEAEDKWSPSINIGTSVLIPEHYVADLSLRMELYRRIAAQETAEEINAFAIELVDRFGPLPDEVSHLIEVMMIKYFCRQANIEKIEAGPKGAVLSFRENRFDNPGGLVEFISRAPGSTKLRADHKLVHSRSWQHPEDRLKGVLWLAQNLAKIAKAA
ncbi:transcription-repair coupling factor [Sneathiella chungangensis]|uniref:Transcription-repair-coupling factor n=1 Tax=Sneathiella chungangensis TaxID=1418234 RepID=A0A845M7S0_9PROT|nr:transcription-repair coupling factor [Sneathiella chungangensis]MZR20888.1 transcription-repair coupling factor [Sneathiella chungangensis]